MSSGIRTMIVTAVMAVGLVAFLPADTRAADVGDLIKIIEATKPPASVGEQAWVRTQLDARKQLTQLGGPAVRPLLDLVQRANTNAVKITALTALSLMKDNPELQAAGPDIAALLKHKNAGVRYLAAKTLGVMKYKDGAGDVEAMLSEKDEALRIGAVDSLGRIGASKSALPMVPLLNDPDPAVRLHTIHAIGLVGVALISDGQGGTVDAVALLTEKLKGQDISERNAAVTAVNNMLGYDLVADSRWLLKQFAPVLAVFDAWWQKTLADRRFKIPGAAELSLRLNIMSPAENLPQPVPVRLKAIEIIQRLGDPRAVSYLASVMQDPDKSIRRALTEAATVLSGIKIEYKDTYSETEWFERVEAFRRAWDEKTK